MKQNKFYFFDRLSSNAINWLHALIFGYQDGYKCEMNRILDELVKRNNRIVLKRWQKGKNGRKWKRDWMILEWRWIEWNGCDRVIDEVEMIIENVNMSDSKRESYWELNSD